MSIAARALLVLFMTAAFVLGTGPSDAADPVDKRIEKSLKRLKLEYDIDSDNDFLVVLPVGKGRTQLVVIRSRTESYGSLEIREVMSPAYSTTEGPISLEVANRLLRDNAQRKVGGWQVHADSERFTIVFSARIPGKVSHRQLRDTIDAVILTADQMEQELTTGDDY